MKYPVTQWNTEEHDKCPMHFPHRSCTCDCGHKGERTLESRGMTLQPYIPPRAIKAAPETE
jgi:hypothetical protein